MKIGYRVTLAAGFVAAVAVASAAFAQTAAPSPGDDVLGQSSRKPRHVKGRMDALVHSETKVQTDDGFATIVADRGDVVSVSGNTITIKRADGETVAVTAGSDTKIRRDGEEAALSAIKAGDKAHIVQVVTGGATKVRAIRAFSPGFKPQDRPAGERRIRRFGPGAPGEGAPPVVEDGGAEEPAFFEAA